MDTLNMIKVEALVSAWFVTLTYPDVFPRVPAKWKRDRDAFLKRLRRKYPGMASVWRLEWKPRKSGARKGQLAPHLHLLILQTPDLDTNWLCDAWHEVVGTDDAQHLEHGASAERVRSRRGVMAYASKAMCGESASPPSWTGRVWGVAGRQNLPIEVVTEEVAWSEFFRLRRVLSGWVERRVGRRFWMRFAGQGITAYLDDATAARVLVWAVTDDEPSRSAAQGHHRGQPEELRFGKRFKREV